MWEKGTKSFHIGISKSSCDRVLLKKNPLLKSSSACLTSIADCKLKCGQIAECHKHHILCYVNALKMEEVEVMN